MTQLRFIRGCYLLCLIISIMAIVGHVSGHAGLTNYGFEVAMSMPSAVAFILLSVAGYFYTRPKP
jgi:hypothetical protein